MTRFVGARALLQRKPAPAYAEHGKWPAPTGRPRVLIENPDAADLWAQANVLREAGYDVAVCAGPAPEPEPRHGASLLAESTYWEQPAPKREPRTICPLVSEGRCPLVEGADVVVSSVSLAGSREILHALDERGTAAIVVEGTRDELAREPAATGAGTRLELPVTARRLVDAVERALAARAGVQAESS